MAVITRRQLITAAAGVTLAGVVPSPARAIAINPRSAWGSDLPPKGPLQPEDVRFLIVHHSASHNGHGPEDVPAILRSWYHYHTGPEKGWNDVAYNFVIDSEGGIWEARQGSIDGPVAGDATGGNQGFTQLVAIIGDYNQAHPTEASLIALAQLLAWLADRYGIATSPGSEVTFVSRGSNKWPEGTEVTAPTITGHRDMSKTTCPGENLYPYVLDGLMKDVQAVRDGGSATPSPTSTTTPPTSAAPSSTTSSTTTSTTTTMPGGDAALVSPARSPTTSSTLSPSTTRVTPASTPTTMPPVAAPLLSRGSRTLLVGAGSLVAVGSGLLIWRLNRLRP